MLQDTVTGLQKFAEQFPAQYFYYGHTLKNNFISLLPPIFRHNICVFWLYGPTGTNKSRISYKLLNNNTFIKESKTKWWHNYLGEKHAIIDDFTPKSIDVQYLLRWFDRYPCSVESKGSTCYLQTQFIIVTSNYHPDTVYAECPDESKSALLRRLKLYKFPDEEHLVSFHFNLYHLCCPQLHDENTQAGRLGEETLPESRVTQKQ